MVARGWFRGGGPVARVMLCQPWNFHDEGVVHDDLENEWRCEPSSLVLPATLLRRQGHTVGGVGVVGRLVANRGDLPGTLDQYAGRIREFQPDIIGMGFFSIHYIEVQRLVRFSRGVCERAGLRTTFIAGGIHASTEPSRTLTNLDFDYVFIGEAEISLPKFCDGADPRTIPGVLGHQAKTPGALGEAHATGAARLGTLMFPDKSEVLHDLDTLPFPDYSLVNHAFYARPHRA